MKLLPAALAVAVVLAPAAYADCAYPPAPTAIPDGNTATLNEMIAAMKVIKSYNEQITAYLSCIELERDTRVASAGATLTKQQKDEMLIIEIQKHNAAVDQLKAVANRFNTQVRIFKARDKASSAN